jgi:hypothetical protein
MNAHVEKGGRCAGEAVKPPIRACGCRRAVESRQDPATEHRRQPSARHSWRQAGGSSTSSSLLTGPTSNTPTYGCRAAARPGSSSIHTAAGLSAPSFRIAQADVRPAGRCCSRAGKPLGGSGGGGGGSGCCALESAGCDAAHNRSERQSALQCTPQMLQSMTVEARMPDVANRGELYPHL